MNRKLKTIILSSFFFLIAHQCLAANWPVPAHTWGGSSTDSADSVAVDSAGNVYVAGSTDSFGAGGQDVLITKYDPTGQWLWSRTWGGAGNDYAASIKVGPDGFLYVSGGTSSYGAGWYDLLLLKLDLDGNLVWGTTWGGSSYEGGYDIAFDANGNVYVVGESYSTSPCCAAVLLKFSPAGALLQAVSYKGPATYDSGYSLTVDSNFNVIVAGISWDYSYSPLHNSILLLKFDPNGNLIWQENWASPFPSQDESSAFHALSTDKAGNIYVGGRHSAQCQNSNFSQCDFDALLLKLDANGKLLWERTWGTVSAYDTAGSVVFDRQGDIVVSGILNFFGTPSPFVFSYDENGALLSQTRWAGTSSNASLGAMDFDALGNGFLVGSATNNQGGWATATSTVAVLSNSLVSNSFSVGNPSFTPSALTIPTQPQTGVKDTGGGGADLFVAKYTGTLLFPVKRNATSCKTTECSPATANISSVFDHQMNLAYESSEDPKKKCAKLADPPPTWGTIMDFEGEIADAPPPKGSFGVCGDLHGYTSQMAGTKFLAGFNLQEPTYLYYDGHPGYDYPFAFKSGAQTGLFPAIKGCVTYKRPAAGASAKGFHVLTIIPQAKKPASCVGVQSDTGYTVAYLHLSSFPAADGIIQRCLSTATNPRRCVTIVNCPTCAREGDWVDTSRADPIAYVGDFDHGQWHAVGPHLHFEVDKWISGAPVPLDPYGWNPLTAGQADPYADLHPDVVNTWLWK
jgi:hypothetical protein